MCGSEDVFIGAPERSMYKIIVKTQQFKVQLSYFFLLNLSVSEIMGVLSIKRWLRIRLSRYCRNSSSTPQEQETTLPRNHATFFYSFQCSKYQGISLSSASMALVQFKIAWKKISVLLHCQLLTTTCIDQPHNPSTTSL